MIRWLIFCIAIFGYASTSTSFAQDSQSSQSGKEDQGSTEQYVVPWDFDPYRVMIWIAGADANVINGPMGADLRAYLDRDFRSLWRVDVSPVPTNLNAIVVRDFETMDYAKLTANDLVLVIKRDHKEAARIRFPADIPDKLGRIVASSAQASEVRSLLNGSTSTHTQALAELIDEVEGSILDLPEVWADGATEAMFLPRGVALKLDPTPKMIDLSVSGRMANVFDEYDKLFLVSIKKSGNEVDVRAREIDCKMRWPGPTITYRSDFRRASSTIGRAVTEAFAPMVRLDEVGNKTIQARLRAGGLILDENSPANIKPGDYLLPLLRKDDRIGEPSFIGLIDWTYLRTLEKYGSKLTLDSQSGRAGALAGRRNSRTHRLAIKIRPVFPHTILRLHAKGDPLAPLAGYDVFERDLETDEFSLIGQTDWDGRLQIDKTDSPLRMLYVKNGSFVLAKLPLVPGQTEMETADLVGDDIRLQAEAYIRGVQNTIIDLVAIRKLLAGTLRAYIKQGDLTRAEELLEKLRAEPSYDKLTNDMELKRAQITSRNRTEQAKIDRLFSETRALLIKHINPSFIRELESEFNAAKGLPAATTELETAQLTESGT